MFKIESDVPMPAVMGAGGRLAKYPFGNMAVGESFLIPPDDEGFFTKPSGARMHRAQQAMGHWRAKGMRFSARTQPDGSMRIWRAA